MENMDTGILLNDQNIKLHRQWFVQMCKLLGIKAQYRSPIGETKKYNNYGEIDAHYNPAIAVGCIYDEHPTQKTMQKLGWNAEMADTSVLIHVPYDLQGLQAGAIFIIPAAIDTAEPRVFRVLRMSTIAVYPASIACELGPVLFDKLPPEAITDFTESNFNLLDPEPGYEDLIDESVLYNNLLRDEEE